MRTLVIAMTAVLFALTAPTPAQSLPTIGCTEMPEVETPDFARRLLVFTRVIDDAQIGIPSRKIFVTVTNCPFGENPIWSVRLDPTLEIPGFLPSTPYYMIYVNGPYVVNSGVLTLWDAACNEIDRIKKGEATDEDPSFDKKSVGAITSCAFEYAKPQQATAGSKDP